MKKFKTLATGIAALGMIAAFTSTSFAVNGPGNQPPAAPAPNVLTKSLFMEANMSSGSAGLGMAHTDVTSKGQIDCTKVTGSTTGNIISAGAGHGTMYGEVDGSRVIAPKNCPTEFSEKATLVVQIGGATYAGGSMDIAHADASGTADMKNEKGVASVTGNVCTYGDSIASNFGDAVAAMKSTDQVKAYGYDND